MKAQSSFHWLKERGFRITPVRKAVIDFFEASDKPFSIADVASGLQKKGIVPNKTTLYREVDFLCSQGLIQEVNLNESRRFYEWNKGHHHHLVCQSCDRVEEIDMNELEAFFKTAQIQLKKNTRFKNIQHSLEFYGVCSNC